MEDKTATQADSATSPMQDGTKPTFQRWLRVGAIAATSALAGGLAAAWYYRKTLKTLQEAETSGVNPEFRIPDDETEHDA
jgi:hypothetical protein